MCCTNPKQTSVGNLTVAPCAGHWLELAVAVQPGQAGLCAPVPAAPPAHHATGAICGGCMGLRGAVRGCVGLFVAVWGYVGLRGSGAAQVAHACLWRRGAEQNRGSTWSVGSGSWLRAAACWSWYGAAVCKRARAQGSSISVEKKGARAAAHQADGPPNPQPVPSAPPSPPPAAARQIRGASNAGAHARGALPGAQGGRARQLAPHGGRKVSAPCVSRPLRLHALWPSACPAKGATLRA